MSVTFHPSGYRSPDPEGELDDPLCLNVHSANAAMLLRSLGIEATPCGNIDPEVLLVAIADADPIDTGAPMYEEPHRTGHPRMIHGAIHPGYHTEKYTELKVVAMYAREHGVEVVWA